MCTIINAWLRWSLFFGSRWLPCVVVPKSVRMWYWTSGFLGHGGWLINYVLSNDISKEKALYLKQITNSSKLIINNGYCDEILVYLSESSPRFGNWSFIVRYQNERSPWTPRLFSCYNTCKLPYINHWEKMSSSASEVINISYN